MIEPKILSEADLLQFTGTETWYRHSLVCNLLYTEGVKFIADRAGAYWLVDEIALAQISEPCVAREEFQVWKLTVQPGHTATLVCEDGNGNRVFGKAIEFTDFPLSDVKLFFTDKVILLPSEY